MKVGGHRNFGWGRKMAWAGRQALNHAYGGGHYATVAAHASRWGEFARWAKEQGIRDARDVTREVLERYGQHLAQKVEMGVMKTSYAQNLLSSANVTLSALRQDDRVRVSPRELVGQRTTVRTDPPKGLDRDAVARAADALRERGHERAAAVIELARDLGLRMREASMLDAKSALRQAERTGRVDIREGTKGGRGAFVERLVPVSDRAMETLRRAAEAQGEARNLIPTDNSWKEFRNHVHGVWREVRDEYGLGKIHDLRAAYACERYEELTGHKAPVLAGGRTASDEDDKAARKQISYELGHGRMDVASEYIGGRR